MRNENVKVVIWGLGAMGSGMAKLILSKKGFTITGVCDRNPRFVGKNLFQILKLEQKDHPDVIVKTNIEEIVTNKGCDVVILATDSYTAKAFPKIKWLLEHQVNVISTAEEMAYPKAKEPKLALELHQLALENGVTVLGTGINPGMMMDLLVIAMTGVMEKVDEIAVSRVNSLSPFGETVMEEQGVGLSIAAFKEKKQQGLLAGHVGFRESIAMIADALGWNLTKFSQSMEPIITEVDRKSAFGQALCGHVAGVDMIGEGEIDGKPLIHMRHPQQIEPQSGGVITGDYITILGNPQVNLRINPEIDGGKGTIAIVVNMIPHVINAKPGLKTMLDLPVPRAIMGDVRKMID
ncbi:MAG: 2,4-diaminopentanoate dehydrogenase [Bacilli bacterium]